MNRCSLPAAVLGGLAFQRHPARLALDGVEAFHRLIPHLLSGEDEYMVVGGLYEVRCTLY